jgi:hypothetical protein
MENIVKCVFSSYSQIINQELYFFLLHCLSAIPFMHITMQFLANFNIFILLKCNPSLLAAEHLFLLAKMFGNYECPNRHKNPTSWN